MTLYAASRRQVLQRLTLMAAASGLPLSAAAQAEAAAAWPSVLPKPIQAPGYGTDPDLVQPLAEPWPRTLDDTQLQLLSTVADILLPADESSPAASQIGVPGVVDHWLSAPYPVQRQHRITVLQGFIWLDSEAQRRFNSSFAAASLAQQLQIVDEIAFEAPPEHSPLHTPAAFFDLLRRLVCGAYYSSPEGLAALGYMGNVPIAGDYPGPSAQAMQHLLQQLQQLDLTL